MQLPLVSNDNVEETTARQTHAQEARRQRAAVRARKRELMATDFHITVLSIPNLIHNKSPASINYYMCHSLTAYDMLSQPYTAALADPCPFCGAPLLQAEVFGYEGHRRVTPCCGNGKITGLLPEMPRQMQTIIQHPRWTTLNRHINHEANWVTTWTVPNQANCGKGFHNPLPPPCYLNLHGIVYHCLRQAAPSASSAVARSLAASMGQWHVTPEPDTLDADSQARSDLLHQFQVIVPTPPGLQCTADFRRNTACTDATLTLGSAIAPENVAALYHTADADDTPPSPMLAFRNGKLLNEVSTLFYSLKNTNSFFVTLKFQVHLHCMTSYFLHISRRCADSGSFLFQGEVDRYAFPVLFPTGEGCFDQTRTDINGKHVTRAQWSTFLMYHLSVLPHWIHSNRTLQEWTKLLHTPDVYG